MTANHVLLQNITLNASASSVTFSSIPQTGYTDLVVKISPRVDNANWIGGVDLTFNSSRTTNLRRLFATNNSVYSDTNVGNAQGEAGLTAGATATASTFASTEIYIPNYTSTNPKSYSLDTVVENNSTTNYLVALFAGLNSSVTTGITSITFSTSGYNFVAGSSFSLYGIAALGTEPTVVPAASGGDIVTNDGTYWYHAFLSSGTFIPSKSSLSCDVLVVAGGGGAGTKYGGGGGAGGYQKFTSQSLSTTAYTVTVGAGGAGASASTVTGVVGSNSQFGALTASVGGGGGGSDDFNGTVGSSGGSGGGGGTIGAGSAGTSGQGNAGGSGQNNGTYYAAGGGGGAGATGSNGVASTRTGGNGGVGLADAITGGSTTGIGQLVSGSYYLAGGGGGGAYVSSGTAGSGGNGGGGAASLGSSGSAGTVNTGGGGGGNSNVGTGGAGGSGIVIIRYAMA